MKKRAFLALASVVIAGCSGSAGGPPATTPGPADSAAPAASAAAVASAQPSPAASAASAAASAAGGDGWTFKATAFPGVTGPASIDYLASDRVNGRVWVPIGGAGAVAVFDGGKGAFTRVDGFKTAERDMRGQKRIAGPSSAAAGDGVVYVGNRGSSEVCAVDAKTLALGACLGLPAAPDGLQYVRSAKELWVTTPKRQSMTILDASKPGALTAKAEMKLDGAVEGYAVDEGRGLVYTNLEDKGGTLVIDVKTRKVKATWSAGCGADGPRGIAVDAGRQLVFVACTDHLQVLDAAHDGAPLGKLDTGAGLDNIDYVEEKGLLFAAAGKAGKLTVARPVDKGQLEVVATGVTSPGARNAVADAAGNAYVPDGQGARLLVFAAPPSK
jgi:hypothetical protein